MNILFLLQSLLPILGTLTHKPEIAELAQKLITIGEADIARRMAERGQTRDEVLGAAAKDWDAVIKGADDLKALP